MRYSTNQSKAHQQPAAAQADEAVPLESSPVRIHPLHTEPLATALKLELEPELVSAVVAMPAVEADMRLEKAGLAVRSTAAVVVGVEERFEELVLNRAVAGVVASTAVVVAVMIVAVEEDMAVIEGPKVVQEAKEVFVVVGRGGTCPVKMAAEVATVVTCSLARVELAVRTAARRWSHRSRSLRFRRRKRSMVVLAGRPQMVGYTAD
jgi:hypothetical protein